MNASKLAEQFLALPVEASIDEVRAVLVGVEVISESLTEKSDHLSGRLGTSRSRLSRI